MLYTVFYIGDMQDPLVRKVKIKLFKVQRENFKTPGILDFDEQELSHFSK